MAENTAAEKVDTMSGAEAQEGAPRPAVIARDVELTYRHITQITVKESMARLFGRRGESKVRSHKALRGVSFEIEQGSTLGIVGKNGCGKTTLLRCLARIYEPDAGELTINASSVSLLALGVGFDATLSGLQNIYLSALLRGFSRAETDMRLRDIIEFAEIGEFICEPVKTYSSGMRSRLAFAIAVNFEPEILLIDEILSVGDEAFKAKSFARMRSIISDSRHTIVIVSHNLSQLKELCDEVMWMEAGRVVMKGEPEYVIKQYLKSVKA